MLDQDVLTIINELETRLSNTNANIPIAVWALPILNNTLTKPAIAVAVLKYFVDLGEKPVTLFTPPSQIEVHQHSLSVIFLTAILENIKKNKDYLSNPASSKEQIESARQFIESCISVLDNVNIEYQTVNNRRGYALESDGSTIQLLTLPKYVYLLYLKQALHTEKQTAQLKALLTLFAQIAFPDAPGVIDSKQVFLKNFLPMQRVEEKRTTPPKDDSAGTTVSSSQATRPSAFFQQSPADQRPGTENTETTPLVKEDDKGSKYNCCIII